MYRISTAFCDGVSVAELCLWCSLLSGSSGEFAKSAYVTSFLSLYVIVREMKEAT